MTNQQINAIYWTLPACFQDAINLCIFWGHTATAASTIRELSRIYALGEIAETEAREWAKWRKALRQARP